MAAPASRARGAPARHGFQAMVFSSAFNRVASLAAQLVLASVLLPSQFGTYAVALSLATVVKTFQDVGVRELLIQASDEDYRRLLAPVFWLSMLVNTLAALTLAAAATFVEHAYNLSGLRVLLWFIAAQIILLTPWTVTRASLQRKLRFSTVVKVESIGAIFQFGGSIVLALTGAGLLSFVIFLPISAVIRTLAGYVASDVRPWRGSVDFAVWPRLGRPLGWITVGTLAQGLFSQGDYLVLGGMVPVEVLGAYFFAYQLASQIEILLGSNVQQVMFPIFSRMRSDRAELRRVARSTVTMLVFVATFAGVLLAATFPALQVLVWNGRWADAVVATAVFGMCFPFRVLYAVPKSTLYADGQFKFWAILTVILAAGMLGSAFVAGRLFESAGGLAAVIGAYLLLAGLASSVWALARLGLAVRVVLADALLPFGVGLLCLGIGTGSVQWVDGASARFTILLFLTPVLYFGAIRIVRPRAIVETITMLPDGVAVALGSVLRLPTAH